MAFQKLDSLSSVLSLTTSILNRTQLTANLVTTVLQLEAKKFVNREIISVSVIPQTPRTPAKLVMFAIRGIQNVAAQKLAALAT